MTRRSSKRKVLQKSGKTELGKYSGKYALTELLVCGECGSPYKRVTWARDGKKRIVWRCVSRLEFGTKYCHVCNMNLQAMKQQVLWQIYMLFLCNKKLCRNSQLQKNYRAGSLFVTSKIHYNIVVQKYSLTKNSKQCTE